MTLYYTDPTTFGYSQFGRGIGISVWSYVNCRGWEDNVNECSKSVYPFTSCFSYNVAGVRCKDSKYIHNLTNFPY